MTFMAMAKLPCKTSVTLEDLAVTNSCATALIISFFHSIPWAPMHINLFQILLFPDYIFALPLNSAIYLDHLL